MALITSFGLSRIKSRSLMTFLAAFVSTSDSLVTALFLWRSGHLLNLDFNVGPPFRRLFLPSGGIAVAQLDCLQDPCKISHIFGVMGVSIFAGYSVQSFEECSIHESGWDLFSPFHFVYLGTT